MDSEGLARLADAMADAASAIAKQPATLISVTFDRIAEGRGGEVRHHHVTITRATRTLVFSGGSCAGTTTA
jgi:hypothetical protein